MTTKNEHPALFTAPMVRAIGTGQKTQTRRTNGLDLVNLLDTDQWLLDKVDGCWAYFRRKGTDGQDAQPGKVRPGVLKLANSHRAKSPYGQPGDRIYVRETFALEDCGSDGNRIIWKEDRAAAWESTPHDIFWLSSDYEPKCGWSPSIHMPRRFARYLLDVTTVRVERLQDISEEDAQAEGCSGWDPEPAAEGGTYYVWKGRSSAPCPRAHFRCLWQSIYGAESWDANPWVWVTTFKLAGERARS